MEEWMEKNIRKILVLFAIFVLISAVYGCTELKSEILDPTDDEISNESIDESLFFCKTPVVSSRMGNSLEGNQWILQFYRKSTALENVNSTILFSKGVVSGSAGCNHYSGTYEFQGESEGMITISQLTVTEAFCLSPEGIMEQEAFFLETIGDVERFELSPKCLMIFRSDGEALTFKLLE